MARKVTLVYDANGSPVQGSLCPEDTIIISYDGTTRNADALEAVEIVRLISTTDCHIKFGNAVVEAVVTDMLLKANLVEYFSLRGNTYIAAIKDVGAGDLFVTIMV